MGTNWFTEIPQGATVLVQNAGKDLLQGCICLTSDELTEQFGRFNNGVVGFEYQSGNLDLALFANVLNHKIHQTDEYSFISNFNYRYVICNHFITQDNIQCTFIRNDRLI